MTDRARNLTRGATTLEPASGLRVFAGALEQLGYDVAALLALAGLQRPELDDPDALVPCEAVATVVRAALEQRRVPNLGAHMAFRTPLGAYPLLDYLVVTTDTVGDALRQLERYFHLGGAPFRLELVHDTEWARLVVTGADTPFIAQYETAIVVHHLREETGGRVTVSAVSLVAEPDDRRDLERLLGVTVRAPATWNGIEFPRDAMRVPLRRRDPVLRRVLEDGAPPSPETDRAATTSDRVRARLASRIGRGDLPDMARVARQLAMGTRTLQRRLAAEGVSYTALIDEARRAAAERLLVSEPLSVAEVGYLLGFSEPSAFHRAFKRWSGKTPLEYRRAVRR